MTAALQDDHDGMEDRILRLLERGGAEQITETHEGYMSTCPLPDHDDSTPSFTINTDNGLWVCFGCAQSGNLPILAHKILGVPLSDAVDAWSLDRSDWTWPERESVKQVDYLSESVLIPYRRCPTYMLDRGFTKAFLRDFEIGYDSSEHRVVFPIRDHSGLLVGVTKRTIFDGVYPKYRHSKGFQKARFLYLSHRLSPGRRNVVFVTEGHVDALRLYSLWGVDGTAKWPWHHVRFGGAVALMGAMISKEQVRLLGLAGFDAVALAYDTDNPGRAGAALALQKFREAGFASIYELEYPGKDPGDLRPTSKVSLKEL